MIPNTYTFDPTEYLRNYGLDNGVNFNCLWSFGDGQYSTEYTPTHTYPIFDDERDYQVALYATPIYSPIGPPPAAYVASNEFIHIGGGAATNPVYNDSYEINLTYNRSPRAGYESTFILTYRNMTNDWASFPVEFYYHDDYFDFEGFNAPGGEFIGYDSPITTLGNNYNRKAGFLTDNTPLAPNEERTIFIQMTALTTVIGNFEVNEYGDIVNIENAPTLYAEARSFLGTAGTGIALERNAKVSMIGVGSWDPNNKISYTKYLNRDNISFPKTMKYRINFENVGTAPTGRVVIEDLVSPNLDINSLRYVGDKSGPNSNPNLGITPSPNPNLTITTDPNSRIITYDFTPLALEGTNSPNDFVNLEDCRYWFEIEFDINEYAFEDNFVFSPSCINTSPIGTFGTPAEIFFDSHQGIVTNSANTEVYCEVISRETPPLQFGAISPNPTLNVVSVDYIISAPLDLIGATFTLVNINTGVSKLIANPPVLNETVGGHAFSIDLSNEISGRYKIVIQKPGLIFETSTIVKI